MEIGRDQDEVNHFEFCFRALGLAFSGLLVLLLGNPALIN